MVRHAVEILVGGRVAGGVADPDEPAEAPGRGGVPDARCPGKLRLRRALVPVIVRRDHARGVVVRRLIGATTVDTEVSCRQRRHRHEVDELDLIGRVAGGERRRVSKGRRDITVTFSLRRCMNSGYPSGFGRLALTSVSEIAAWQVAR